MGNHQKGGSSLRGMYVEVRNNDIGRAMRKLKKMVSNENIFQEVREKEAFEKPSLRPKKAKAAARKRWLKEQQKNAEK